MSTSSSLARYAILNDIHFPFEDRTAYSVALDIIKSVNPEHIFLNGDIGEFISISTHPKHPADQVRLEEELSYINKRFDELQELFPKARVTLIEGNHCYRFFRYIRDIAPQMWGVVDCPKLLKFDQRPGWKFVVYGPTQLVKCGESNLYLRHEPLGSGKHHSKASAEHMLVDLAYGHTHTFQSFSHRKFGPEPITTTAYSLGWLGDKSRHVFDYRGPKDSWVKGITIIECEKSSGKYSLEFIPIEKYPVMYRGKLFKHRAK